MTLSALRVNITLTVGGGAWTRDKMRACIFISSPRSGTVHRVTPDDPGNGYDDGPQNQRGYFVSVDDSHGVPSLCSWNDSSISRVTRQVRLRIPTSRPECLWE